ncbi:MAG: superoxide dismutase family protein [Actinomycetota bacterium]
MKKLAQLILVCVLAITLIASPKQPAYSQTNSPALQARATLKSTAGSRISGEVTFQQINSGFLPGVKVKARVSGLEPNSRHGIHIHEVGTCQPDFTAAGGHFDPGPFGQSNPDSNHPFHMGDLPNLVANAQGVATLEHITSRISLSPGPLTLFDDNGSAIIIHGNEDRGTTGVQGGSGGPRSACGPIQKV